jgi:hypothetical protein
MAIHWNTERLNKDLARIDGAILAGRYNLAMKLAHRSLRQYYRLLIDENGIPTEQVQAENVRQMAIYISKYLLKYFRKYEIPHSERRLMFIALASNIIFMSNMSITESPEDSPADKALATYARENVGNIISYLMKYFG